MKHTRATVGETHCAWICQGWLSTAALLFALLFTVGGSLSSPAQTVPAATASASQQLLASFSNPVVGHLAANNLGDVFYVNSAYSGSANLYWLPRGTTTPVQLATGFSGARNVYVDSANNVYVPNAYSGNILEIPYANGTYATGLTISSASPSACGSYTPTAPCYQFGSVGAIGGYYYQPVDMGFDRAGNAYILNAYANGSCAGNCILKFAKNNDAAATYTPTLVISNITAQAYGAQIAVDPAGDVFYEDGTHLYVVSAGTTSAVAFGTGISSPAGVSVDPLGNLYVTNSASPFDVYEFPATNGTVRTGTQFAVLNSYSGDSVAVTSLGEMYYTGYSGGPTLNLARLNGIYLGAAAVGTAVATTPTTVTFTFSAATTVAGITSSGPGFTYTAGSCAAAGAYTAANSCTVNVNYTPTAVGLQRGAVNLTAANGSSIASASLAGVGIGAAQTNDPGSVSAIGGGFTSPTAITVDSSGNVFIADAGRNAVLQYPGGTGTPVSIGTGLSRPTSVAVDNAGNVFIADAGNGRVVEVPSYNGTLTNSGQTSIISGLGTSLGIAFDYQGNLYIADSAKTSITELLNVGGVPRSSSALSLGTFTAPVALATDPSGNLFVADFTANSVSRIAFIGRAQTPVSAAFSKPTGVATDASGSVYVADSGNSRLVKVPLEAATYNTNDQYLVGATVAVPYAVAIDAAGNLYVVDNSKATASLINRTAGSLSLGRVQAPQTSSALNATIADAGNAPLTFGTPLYTATSTTPSYFTITSPSGNGCAAGASLATGVSCVLSASFTPQASGTFTDLLTFTNNAANATTKTLTLTGVGVNLAADTLTLSQTSATANFGSPVTIQAAVTSTVSGTPTGNVSFTVDGNSQSTAPAINAAGIANITLSNLTGGAHVICGSYTGDNSYRPNSSCITITVNKVGTATTLVITGGATTPVSSSVSQSVTLTATVVPGATTPVTGNVVFTVGSQTLGTAILSAGQAVLTTVALPAGTDTVTATYAGDVNYLTSAATAVDIVTYPTLVVTPSMSTISAGTISSGTMALTVTALGGFNGSVGLRCSGLPANTICSFSPNQFILNTNAPQSVTLQILTGQTPVIAQPVVGASMGAGGKWTGLLLLSLAPLLLWSRRRLAGRLLRSGLTLTAVVLLGSATTFFTGCSSSKLFGDTPPGTYNVTISATGTGTAAYTYANHFASGCSIQPAPADPANPTTAATCTETAAVALTVQ